jgi:hypothetical protein
MHTFWTANCAAFSPLHHSHTHTHTYSPLLWLHGMLRPTTSLLLAPYYPCFWLSPPSLHPNVIFKVTPGLCASGKKKKTEVACCFFDPRCPETTPRIFGLLLPGAEVQEQTHQAVPDSVQSLFLMRTLTCQGEIPGCKFSYIRWDSTM